MSQTGKIQLVLSPQAERYVRRDAPVEVRRMAARGALPLAPVELATVLFALLHDPDDQVKVEAERSLAGLPLADEKPEEVENWIQQRMTLHRAVPSEHLQHRGDGLWLDGVVHCRPAAVP